MIKKTVYCLLIVVLLLGFSTIKSFAQISPIGNSLEMNLEPQNPEPGQNVRIILKSFGYDINRAQITWFINGQEKNTGIGAKEFNTTAGSNGEKTTIKAVVTPLDKSQTEIEAFFIPSSVDLIYESLSYVPPFYQGRAMNSNQGVVLVVAIPNLIDKDGSRIPAQKIIYSWKKDGKVQQDLSGVGKNTFTFSGSVPIRDAVIEVVASSLDATIFSSKSITITNGSPKVVFYENNPIYGIMLNKAIKGTVQMLSDEFSVIAVPYFFSAGYAATPDLDYNWSLNDRIVGLQEPKNSFTVRQESKGSGTANIGLKIGNNVRIFQLSDGAFTINFQKQ